jgi:hypothetical protein
MGARDLIARPCMLSPHRIQRHMCARGSKVTGRAHEGRMRCGEHEGGHDTGTEALEGGGPRRDGSVAALPHSGEQSRTIEGK